MQISQIQEGPTASLLTVEGKRQQVMVPVHHMLLKTTRLALLPWELKMKMELFFLVQMTVGHSLRSSLCQWPVTPHKCLVQQHKTPRQNHQQSLAVRLRSLSSTSFVICLAMTQTMKKSVSSLSFRSSLAGQRSPRKSSPCLSLHFLVRYSALLGWLCRRLSQWQRLTPLQ